MDKGEFDEFTRLYKSWSNEELIKAVNFERDSYRPDVLDIIESELVLRKIAESEENNNIKQYKIHHQKYKEKIGTPDGGLFIGWGIQNWDTGYYEEGFCENCCEERNYHLYLTYRYFKYLVIFGCVFDVQYIMACQLCQKGYVIDNQEGQKLSDYQDPFTLLDKYGLLIIIVGIILFALMTILF